MNKSKPKVLNKDIVIDNLIVYLRGKGIEESEITAVCDKLSSFEVIEKPNLGEEIGTLYEDYKVTFERFKEEKYRVSFFNKDLHWAGDITMSPDEGVIFDDVKEEVIIDDAELDKIAHDHYINVDEMVQKDYIAGFKTGFDVATKMLK